MTCSWPAAAVMHAHKSAMIGAAALAVWLPMSAYGQSRIGMDITAGARGATNPFLVDGSSPADVAATLQIDPRVTVEGATTTFRLRGSGRVDRYLDTYGTDTSGTLEAAYDLRFSERTVVTVSASGATTRGGVQDLFRPGAADGDELPVEPVTDVSITGARLRQYSFGGNVRIASRVSARGTVNMGAGARFSRADGIQNADFRQVTADAGYSHILDDRTSIGARLAFSDIDYSGTQVGDGDVLSPAVTATVRLSSTLSASGTLGVSVARITRTPATSRVRTTAFAAGVSLCRRRERSGLCLTGNRDIQPTVLGGVSTVTSVSVNWDLRLSPRDSISASGRYGRTDPPRLPAVQFGLGKNEVIGVTGVYSRRLSERLFLTAAPGYNKANGNGQRREANYQMMLGIRLRLGSDT